MKLVRRLFATPSPYNFGLSGIDLVQAALVELMARHLMFKTIS